MTGTELIQKAKTQNPAKFEARRKWWTREARGRFSERTLDLSAAGDVLPAEAKAMTYEEAKQ